MQVSLCHILETVSIEIYSAIAFRRNPDNTETRQLIWNVNKLTDLYTIRTLTKRYFQIDYTNPPITHPLSQYDNNNNNNKRKMENRILLFLYCFT